MLLFSTILTCSAQIYFPSPNENPYWTEESGGYWICDTVGTFGLCEPYFCHCYDDIYYKSDTIISGTLYQQLYKKGECSGIFPANPPPEGCPYLFLYKEPEALLATIRQDTVTRKVYILVNDEEKILYDYDNMHVGALYPSTFKPEFQSDSLIVVSEDSIYTKDIYRKKWGLGIINNGMLTDSGFASIYEGICSSRGLINPIEPPGERLHLFNCFYLDNKLIMPEGYFKCKKPSVIELIESPINFEIFPNPCSNYLNIYFEGISGKCWNYRIINSIGCVEQYGNLTNVNTIIDLVGIHRGIKIIQLYNGNSSLIRKVICL